MAIATFVTAGGGCIDGKSPSGSFPNLYMTGINYLGATKDQQRRMLLGFDLFAPSLEGVTFTSGTQINSADLLQSIQSLLLPVFTEHLDRVTRADWDYLAATWNQYKSGASWTTIGGDVDAVTPGELSFTSPADFGAFVVQGLRPFVADAIANRGGRVLLRTNHATEAGGVTQYHACASDAEGKPRLRVDYVSAAAVSIDDPHGGVLRGARAQRASSAAAPSAAAQPARVLRIRPRGGRR